MKKIGTVCALSLITCFLSACSMQPSQEDINQALQNEVKESNAQSKTVAGGLLGDTFTMQLLNSEKLGDCVKRPDGKTFDCDIKMTVKTSLTGTSTKTAKFPFIKSDKGNWVVLNEDTK